MAVESRRSRHCAICIAIVWKTSSFMALMLLAGLQTIPKSLYEAAEVDGASTWQQFVEITLPMLRPAIFVALIFRTITAIQTFDIPYAMTGGGPGDSTETLAMYIHKTTLDFLDFGYGSALAALMFVLSMVATSGYLRYTRRDPRRGDLMMTLPTRRARWSGSPALIVVVNGFFPALWILLTSLKTETELIRAADHLPARRADARQLRDARSPTQPILRFMWNSFVVASLSTVLCVLVSRARRLCADAAAHARTATSSCRCCSPSRCSR